jgi:multimeric flavodoxin WrbA
VPAAARRLTIVWWSNTGGTEALVEAAARGAREAVAAEPVGDAAFAVLPVRCDRASPAALRAADALLFATPECLGTMAGPMKAFFDRCWYPVLDTIEGRPYATIVCAGSDGQGALRQLERLATGWRLRRVVEPLQVITGAQAPADILAPKRIDAGALARAAELGATLAAGTALGAW